MRPAAAWSTPSWSPTRYASADLPPPATRPIATRALRREDHLVSTPAAPHGDEPPTAGPEYARRLQTLSGARWKRVLDVQMPYRANLRRLHLGRTLDVGCGTGRNLAALDRDRRQGRPTGGDHRAVPGRCRPHPAGRLRLDAGRARGGAPAAGRGAGRAGVVPADDPARRPGGHDHSAGARVRQRLDPRDLHRPRVAGRPGAGPRPGARAELLVPVPAVRRPGVHVQRVRAGLPDPRLTHLSLIHISE